MTACEETRAGILRGLRVLSCGLGTELEFRGARIDGPLWSAHVLEDEPERVAEVHRAIAEAGAEVVASARRVAHICGFFLSTNLGCPTSRF